jgi:hypothetical protein
MNLDQLEKSIYFIKVEYLKLRAKALSIVVFVSPT